MTLALAWLLASALTGALLLSQARGLAFMGMLIVGAAVAAVLVGPVILSALAMRRLGLAVAR